ncbi:MAG: cAMP-activated global transcriptional regulator CRP [Pseudomonadales bacterium]|nr:cAMP-activated global transcriptional regulator CRP [Pseudomonadales bacterium]
MQLQPKTEGLDRFLANCHRQRYPKHSTIVREGDSSESLYFILDGSVVVLIENEEGREMIVSYLNKNDFFGEMGYFIEGNERSALIRAKTECEVAEISYAKYDAIRANYPEVQHLIASQLASRLHTTTRKMTDLAFLDVTGRVARALLDLCKEPDAMTHPEGMQIKITRQEIGRMVGCSREMVGRVLKDLEIQGLLTAKGKTMVVYGTR